MIESLQKFAFFLKFVNNAATKQRLMQHFHRYGFIVQRSFINSSIAPTTDLIFWFVLCLLFLL